MKAVFANIGLFALLTLVFSSMTGCSRPASNNAAVTNTAGVTNSAGNANTGSEYPPLPSGLAEAEYELIDTGAPMKLSEKKGKVILANIWGTWCGPCRAEMPFLVALQDEYREKGLEIIGMNIGDGSGGPESNEKIKTFAEGMKLNYTLARSSNAATTQFYLVTKQQVVPQTILIDRQGRLRGVFVGGGQRIADMIKQNVEKTINE